MQSNLRRTPNDHTRLWILTKICKSTTKKNKPRDWPQTEWIDREKIIWKQPQMWTTSNKFSVTVAVMKLWWRGSSSDTFSEIEANRRFFFLIKTHIRNNFTRRKSLKQTLKSFAPFLFVFFLNFVFFGCLKRYTM